MDDSKLKLLQDMPVFGGIQPDVLTWLLEQAEHVTVKQGEFFFREGEHGGSIFVIEHGRAVVLKRWEEKLYRLHEFAVGDCFGEMSLIDMCPRSASVEALEDCRAIKLAGSDISGLFKRDLEQFALIQMNMAREVSRRLREADQALFQERVVQSKIPLH